MKSIRLLLAFVLIGLVGGGVYLWMFKKTDTVRIAKGYPKSETPQMTADYFKKAISNREYEMAALYCTAGYAEQLKRGHEAASKLGTAIDNTGYQMKERAVLRDEVKVVLFLLDPFPKDISITVDKESGDKAEGKLVFKFPDVAGGQVSSTPWNLNPKLYNALLPQLKASVGTVVPMKKENGEWKFDFPTDAAVQERVGLLNSKYAKYVNVMEQVSSEIKTDPALKETAAATAHMKGLLESAAKE